MFTVSYCEYYYITKIQVMLREGEEGRGYLYSNVYEILYNTYIPNW